MVECHLLGEVDLNIFLMISEEQLQKIFQGQLHRTSFLEKGEERNEFKKRKLLPFATFLMAIGNLAAVIYYIICIQREGKQLSVSFMDFKIELAMLKENFSVGFSAMILDGLLIISSLMFNYYAM